MEIGIIYFIVIVLANSIGAVSGMGGGVIIKPILDFMGTDSVAAVSFYSTVAVFTMSIVSTSRQIKAGIRLDWLKVFFISFGAVIGGSFGNIVFEFFLQVFTDEKNVMLIQIVVTIITLALAFWYSQYGRTSFHLEKTWVFVVCGFLLGFLASFLGIGGGPINVSLMMLLFSMPIKEATVYSIATIFFSQLAKLSGIALWSGFARFDLSMLYFVVPAAIVGGILGARLSQLLPTAYVTRIFQGVILLVLAINVWNGWMILR